MSVLFNLKKILFGCVLICAFSANGFSELKREILTTPGSTEVKFGSPLAAKFILTDWVSGPVSWSVDGFLPPGIQLVSSGNDEAELVGIAKFAGAWCITISAKVTNQPGAEKIVCLIGSHDSTQSYPIINAADLGIYLSFTEGKYDLNALDVEPSSILDSQGQGDLNAKIVLGKLPSGLSFVSEAQKSRVVIHGIMANSTREEFVLELSNASHTPVYYKVSASYFYDADRCPEGSYYSPRHGRCVGSSTSCPRGYFFDFSTGKCEIRQQQCPQGYYFDLSTQSCLMLPRPPRP